MNFQPKELNRQNSTGIYLILFTKTLGSKAKYLLVRGVKIPVDKK